MEYCPKCGNRGITPEGEICACQRGKNDLIYADLVGMDVPAQYQGLRFNYNQVPTDLGPSYPKTLGDLHDRITTIQLTDQNIFLCAPPLHSKTVWAYSCIQNLFRQRFPVLPIYDVLELRRMAFEFTEPEGLYTNKYLFVRVPLEVTHEMRFTIHLLVTRRVKLGCCTIFIYDGSWGMATYGDRFDTLRNMQGDGSFNSLRVLSFTPKRKED